MGKGLDAGGGTMVMTDTDFCLSIVFEVPFCHFLITITNEP
jgi:hypothetical protein